MHTHLNVRNEYTSLQMWIYLMHTHFTVQNEYTTNVSSFECKKLTNEFGFTAIQ